MMADIKIRRPIAEDSQCLLELVIKMNIIHNDPIDHLNVDNIHRDVIDPSSPIKAFVADISGEVAGFVFYHVSFDTVFGNKGLFITDILVDDRFQRQGVGKALLSTVAKEVERLEYSFMWLLSHPWNEKAQKFYKRHGGEEAELIEHFFYGDALKSLQQDKG